MEFSELLTPQRVRCGVEVTSKKRALEAVSQQLLLDRKTEPDVQRAVFEGLTLRERLGSTGLGRGVALPHSRSPAIDHPRAALLQLATPVGFDALDRQPVDLLLALLVPEHSNDEHLRILAQLAEMFRDPAFCEQLRAATTDSDLHARWSAWRSLTHRS